MKLLLSPFKLDSDFLCIESLHVVKDSKGISIENVEPDTSELRKHFFDLPKPGRDALSFFTKQEILQSRQAIAKLNNDPQVIRNTLVKKAHEKILQLKPFANLVKWNHKVKRDNHHYKIEPCLFSALRPNLQFQ